MGPTRTLATKAIMFAIGRAIMLNFAPASSSDPARPLTSMTSSLGTEYDPRATQRVKALVRTVPSARPGKAK